MAPRLHEVLKRARRAAGLTQEALAERAGLSVETISLLERAVGRRPRPATIALLAEALGLTPPERAAWLALGQPGGAAAGVLPASVSSSPGSVVPFVGRGEEVRALARHLGGVGGPLLVLAGEPGIGKSRLLGEAAALGARQGRVVLAGGCRQRGGQDPFAPVADALLGHLRRLPAAQARGQLRGCAWLVKLLPELAGDGGEPLPLWTVSPAQERRLSFDAVHRYLANAAGPAGALLLLDDLQWAGPDALDVLRAVVGEAAQTGLRLVAAYRDTEVPAAPLGQLLGDLAHAGTATQRTLGPLGTGEAAQLLTALLGPGVSGMYEGTARAQLLQRTSGVPFFLVSCAQGLQEGAFTARGGGGAQGGESVPWSVAQGVRQRVGALPPAAQAVLTVAAVAGREASRPLLLAAAAAPAEEVLVALEAACGAHLLEEAGPAAYRFPHDLIREVIETGLGAARRAGLHRTIAAVLAHGLGPLPVEALAYHYAQAGEHAQAAHWLEQAGDEAMGRGASGAALEHYTTAREHVTHSAAAGAVLSRLDEKLGDLHLLTGALAQAVEEFARARSPESDVARRAELRRKEALSRMEGGDYDLALQLLAAADAEGGDASTLPAGMRAAIQLSCGEVHIRRDDIFAAEAAAARAMELLSVEPAVPRRDHAVALAERLHHSVAFFLQDYALADDYAQRSLARSERLGDREGVTWSWKARGFIAFEQGQPAVADGFFRRGLQVAEEIGDQVRASECWRGLAYAAADLQELDRAEACLQRALISAERGGNPRLMANAWVQLAHVSREHGQLDEAITRLRQAEELLTPLTDPPGLLVPWLSLGWCLWRRGDLREAEECLRREVGRSEGTAWREDLIRGYVALGGVAQDQGDQAAAHRYLRQARRHARTFAFAALEVEATVEHGRSYLRAVRRRAALAALARARHLVSAEGAADAAGQVQLFAAELHLQDGQVVAAQAAAAAALRLAAEAEARRVRRLSEDVGSRGRPLQGLAQRLLGTCALLQGAHDAALVHLRAALAVHLELGMALEAARTRLLIAAALVAADGRGLVPDQAQELLAAARSTFASSGAALDLAQAEQVAST